MAVRIDPSTVVFMECDIADLARNGMFRFDTVAHNCNRLAQIATIHDIPHIATKQVKFGEICPEIKHGPKTIFPAAKKTFTMCNEEVQGHLDRIGRKQAVLYGIEAHICIRATALDLIN